MSTKLNRAISKADCFKGPQTIAAIMEQIPQALVSKLTSSELAMVITAVNAAYHNGKASMGAEVVDGDYVWVSCLQKGIDLDVLRRLQKTETRVKTKDHFDGNLCSTYRYGLTDSCAYNDTMTAQEITQSVPRADWTNYYRYDYNTVTTWELV